MSKSSKAKTYTIIALILAIIALISTIKSYQETTNSLREINEEKQSKIQHYINKNNQIVAEKKALEINASDTKILKAYYEKEIASLKNDFNVKIKNLKSYTGVEVTTNGSGVGAVANVISDSIPSTSIYNDAIKLKVTIDEKWLTLEGFITNEDFNYQYQTRDSIKIVSSYTKEKWYKKKHLTVKAISYNPQSSISGLRNIEITENKPKRISIGPSIQYDPFSQKMSLGVSVQWSLIRL